MSLIRVGHHSHHGRAPGRRKRTTAVRKPAWDSTIHDLSVYKATREELIARSMRHQSKNHMAVKLEKMRKDQARKDKTMSPADVRKMAIMKEILYDQSQLEEALSKSDRMMAVVKDLFGDDPKRYTGFPNVTSVTAGSGDQNKSRVVAPVPEIYTKMDALSDSVTNTTALNEYHSSDSDDEYEEVSAGEPIVYEPKMNLERFQQFLASEEERNRTVSSISGPNQASRLEAGPAHSTRLQDSRGLHSTRDGSGFETPKREHNESIEMLRTPRSAINDTKRVKKTKKLTSPQKSSNSGSNTMQFTDFRKVLLRLQEEIAEFEKQTGNCPPAEQQQADSLSGYTVALVGAVTKLARYLRQTDLQLKGEIAVQETVSQDMFQFRTIVDSLTTDLIYTQEEYAKLVCEFERHRCDMTNEIAVLRQELQELKGVSPRQPSVNGAQKTHPEQHCLSQDDKGCGDRASHNNSVIQEHLQPQPSAILLSPLVRKTRLPETAELEAAVPKRQTSLIDISSLAETGPQQQYTVKSAPQYQPPIAVASVTVPRPQPLVQCNVGAVWNELGNVPHTFQTNRETNDVMQTSQSSGFTCQSLPVTGTNRDIAAQIAELNKQHEEAQKRIELLQKGHYLKQQQVLHHEQEKVKQQQQQLQQQQQQELKRHQQQLEEKRQQQLHHQPEAVQQQQFHSGQNQQLAFQDQVQQQQQHQIFQQQLQHHQQSLQHQQGAQHHLQISQPQQKIPQMQTSVQGPQSTYHYQQQHRQEAAGQMSSPRLQEQAAKPQEEQYYLGQHEQQNHIGRHAVTVTSHNANSKKQLNPQLGYHNKNLAAANGVSPPISPISTRSDGVGQFQQTQYNKVPGRGISVSIPTGDLDMSCGSMPSPRLISSQQ